MACCTSRLNAAPTLTRIGVAGGAPCVVGPSVVGPCVVGRCVGLRFVGGRDGFLRWPEATASSRPATSSTLPTARSTATLRTWLPAVASSCRPAARSTCDPALPAAPDTAPVAARPARVDVVVIGRPFRAALSGYHRQGVATRRARTPHGGERARDAVHPSPSGADESALSPTSRITG